MKKWIAKILGSTDAAAQPVSTEPPITDDEKTELSDLVHVRVTGGFDEKADIRESALDYLHPRQWSAADRAWVDGEIDRQWSAKLHEQESWPPVTDFDRLDRVFTELRTQGLIALHCAGNTQSDGRDDTRQFWDEAGGPQSGIDGAIFYHGQDVEHVVQDGSLYLAFGSFPNATRSAIDIAAQVVDALKSAGFDVKMPADESQRILITGLKWQKRSPN
ncbi:MAG: hypothetical protein ABL897_13920 [Hyphomicrobium sp.]